MYWGFVGDNSLGTGPLAVPIAGVENSLGTGPGDLNAIFALAAGSSTATVIFQGTAGVSFLASGDSTATAILSGTGYLSVSFLGDSTATVSFGGGPPPPPGPGATARRIAATQPRANRIAYATAPWYLRRVSSRQPTTRQG